MHNGAKAQGWAERAQGYWRDFNLGYEEKNKDEDSGVEY